MLSENEIRSIAQRYIEPLRNTSPDERRLILENALREALIADQHRREPVLLNGGCL